ncbi:TonB-dependent receptor [Flavobacteriaceae bacterium]|nr:TonB-dependent receptor [Flavobacteriaceae bacterium]
MKTRVKEFFTVALFFVSSIMLAQQDISGTVVEQDTGGGLPGVTIVISGTNKGTTTDFDGNFTISANKGDLLIVSYIGFDTQQITIGDETSISIQLAEGQNKLNEIVVTGYGTQIKKEVTGAVAVIGAESIEKLNPVRIEQALQGQVAGVNITSASGAPGAASNIRIRGVATNGDNRPLILVDGNVIEDLAVINPRDIESVNVLKDASAGIYGVRASNGVILITTKGGRRNMPLKIELNTYTGVQNAAKQIGVLNATEYGFIINESQVAAGNNAPFTSLNALGKGTNWQKQVFQQAIISDTNLTATGGTEKTNYSFGLGYLDQDGIVGGEKSNYNRIAARGNYTLDLLNNLQLKSTAIYTRSNQDRLPENGIGSVLFNALNMNPTLPIVDSNGAYTLAEGLGAEVINPVAQLENNYNTSQINKISATLGLEYTFLNDFSIQSRFQYNHANVKSDIFKPVVNYGSGKVFNIDRNELIENSDNFQDYTWDTFLTYEKSISNHNIKVLLGQSIFKTYGTFESYTGFDLPSNVYGESSLADATEIVDNQEQNKERGANTFDVRLLSHFSRVQYNYKGKYLLSAVVRRDGSTRFGPNNRFGIFPSGSVGWLVSDEDFFTNNNVINFLKFRASYGIIGNDRIGDYRYVSTLAGEATYVSNEERVFGKAEGALSNPEIKWEEQVTSNIGLDANLFNDAVNLSIDYFVRKTKDLLLSAQVSGILGASAPGSSAPTVNAGDIENKGLEFLIGYQGNITRDLKMNVSYNFATLQNKVLFVASENGFEQGGGFGIGLEPPSRMAAGEPIGFFYGFETDGVFQNQAEVNAGPTTDIAPSVGDLRYIDQDDDGDVDLDDRVNIGDPIPDITMGLNLGFNYKNIDFSSSAFASIGNEIVRNYERNQPFVNRRSAVLDRWIGPNSSNENPRVSAGANPNGLFSDYYVEDGSYVRIQNIQIGYTFPDEVLNSMNIKKLRIYGSVNNVYTFTKYSGYDPSASSGDPIGGGIDQGFYPVPRTFMVGLNLTF